MEKLGFEFLSTVAQVSAALIGFALVASVFQAIDGALKGEEYIKKKNLFMKLASIALFPITVLAYPFLFSLFLLLLNKDVIKLHYLLLNVAIAIFYLCYFLKIQKYYELQGEKESHKLRSHELFLLGVRWVPMIILFLIICTGVVLSFPIRLIPPLPTFVELNSSCIFSSHLFLLVVAGFLLILQNLGIKANEGVLFEISKDFKEDDERDKKICKILIEFENKVNKAISERKELINKMEEWMKLLKNKKDKEEVKRSIAKHWADIYGFQEFIFEEFLNKNENILKRIKDRHGYITLREVCDLMSWVEKAEEVCREFQKATKRNEIIFNFISGKEV